jgi:Xaa-Pro aminopeptidase
MKTSFFEHNRKRLVEKLPNQSLTILFAGEAPVSSADQLYAFVPNRNFYYITGIDQPKPVVVLAKTNGVIEEFLFIEKADPVLEKWIGKRMTKEEAVESSGISDIHFLEDFETQLAKILSSGKIESLYLDLEKREWNSVSTPADQFAREIQSRYPAVALRNVYPEICEMRIFKTEEEVENIKEAIRITQDGIRHLMENAKPGMKENQLEAYFDFTLTTGGVKHHAFHTICASGQNGTVLHYEDNDALVEDGSLVLLDLGAQYQYYNADISHTFPVNGTFTEKQKLYYNIVLKALKETTAIIKPGLKFAALNEHTKKVLSEGLIEAGLIEKPEEISKYYYHGVSHFLGLDTHDVGTYKDRVLEPGMVLTVEPGLYIEEEGIGIRIEDDVLVTEDGHENLSADLIREVEELEAFLKEGR